MAVIKNLVTFDKCAIWDNTTPVDIYARDRKCTALMSTALEYTIGSTQFGTQLRSFYILSTFIFDLLHMNRLTADWITTRTERNDPRGMF